MSDKIIKEENLDEIIKNVAKNAKNEKELSDQEWEKLMVEAYENIEFTKVVDDIKLEAPDNRVIFVDGNETLIYDNGEFFMCDTIDSRKLKKKMTRKEATECYIEYFIRYQLNPIIEQKNMDNISKTIQKVKPVKQDKDVVVDIDKKVEKTVVNKVEEKVEKKDKPSTEKVKSAPKKEIKTKEDLVR